MTTLKAVEAKSRFSEILERASKGEEFIVTRRGEPVVRVLPFHRKTENEVRDLLADLKKFRKGLSPVRRKGESWNDLAREGLES